MIRNFVRISIAGMLRLLPPGAPDILYTHILRGPLRSITNAIIINILPQTAQLKEGVIALNPEDPIVSGSLAFGVYEPFETEVFRNSVKPGMTVIDIGANIGYYTVIAASKTAPGGNVIAFEPEPNNYKFLTKTLQKNNFDNVHTHQLAIADKSGILSLNLFESNKGRHSLVMDYQDSRELSKKIDIQATDLDSFLAEHHIDKVDIIKMDIEGAESLALRGMQKTLKAMRGTLFLEITPNLITKIGDNTISLLAELRALGFTLYDIDERLQSLVPILEGSAVIKKILRTHHSNLICRKE